LVAALNRGIFFTLEQHSPELTVVRSIGRRHPHHRPCFLFLRNTLSGFFNSPCLPSSLPVQRRDTSTSRPYIHHAPSRIHSLRRKHSNISLSTHGRLIGCDRASGGLSKDSWRNFIEEQIIKERRSSLCKWSPKRSPHFRTKLGSTVDEVCSFEL
jgi:hypothetical protein